MKDEKTRNDDWAPCVPGVIQTAAAAPRLSRRSLLKGIVATGSILGIVASGAAIGMQPKQQPKMKKMMPGGIACIRVHENLAAFVAGKLNNCKLVKQMTSHLMKCKNCRDAYDDLCTSGEHKSKSCSGSRPTKATIKPCTATHRKP